LRASGYSREDAARDAELAYYEAHHHHLIDHHRSGLDAVDDVDDEEDEDEDEDEDGDERAPELIDMDDFHIRSDKRCDDVVDDGASFAGGGVSVGGMSRMSQLSFAEAEQRARERVRRHLEDRKRASGKRGAFKTRNSNKSFSKGKHVVADFGL